MRKDERDLLEVLKSELEFLKAGGYELSPRTAWRPRYIFEDSLSCMNYDSRHNPSPCGECVLIYLVPPELRSAKIPCRHIPLNTSGETLDSLYRYSDQCEIEETVGHWLRATIQRLQEERIAVRRERSKQLAASAEERLGIPLFQKQHPKCANRACPTAFRWTGGGKFFRFRPDLVSTSNNNPASDSSAGIHGVIHYWLCERCCHVFTLVYEDAYGVSLKLLWTELPTQEAHNELSVA